jgi:hypothetical protein
LPPALLEFPTFKTHPDVSAELAQLEDIELSFIVEPDSTAFTALFATTRGA